MTDTRPHVQVGTARVDHDDDALRERIRQEVLSILRQRVPAVWNDDSHYSADLGLDSLDLVEMVARLEQLTGLFIPDGDVPRLTSIAATAEYVRARRLASR